VEIDGKNYLMPEFIDLVLHSSDQDPAPYLRSKKLYMYFPQLLSEIEPTPPYFLPNWLDGPGARVFEKRFHRGAPALFIGGRGGKFPYMHFDGAHTQAFICELYGTKKFYTYPADQTPYLYVKERYNVSTIPDVERPDFKKFPLFAKATQTSFTLESIVRCLFPDSHRLDESYRVIPQHGCIPAEPASVSSGEVIVVVFEESASSDLASRRSCRW
jgi:histone arginine demethylase JMJD6